MHGVIHSDACVQRARPVSRGELTKDHHEPQFQRYWRKTVAKAAEYLALPLPGRIWHRHPESHEIRSYETPTRIANAPIRQGVVNLRGIIVPIVDIASSSTWARPAMTSHRRHHPNIGKPRRRHGSLDRVSDVTTLMPEQIKPAPEMGRSINTEYVIGLGTIDERMLILVDIDQLMSSADMGLIEKLAA